jgi:D-threo-aldose 1-dehydrogenase
MLGKTNLLVTPLCIGTTALGDMPDIYGFSISEASAHATLQRILSSPFNFLDTASNYGHSEERIGKLIKQLGGLPEGIVLSTKVDRNMQTGEFSGDQARLSLERSLERLGVDYLPLVFLHDPEHSTASFEDIMAPDGPVAVLQEYQRRGVIGHIGISGGPIDMLTDYVNTGVFEAVIMHNRHNLIYQTADPLFDAAKDHNVAVINAAPYGSGILAKGTSYRRFAYKEAPADITSRVEEIKTICDKYAVPLAAVALQFSLRDPRIAATIVGVSEEEHVDSLAANATLPIPEALWEEIQPLALKEGDPERN